MSRQTRVRLCLAMFILTVTMGLAFLPNHDAEAAPCCTWCDATYEGCLAGTYYPVCGGNEACCAQKTASCYSNCNNAC